MIEKSTSNEDNDILNMILQAAKNIEIGNVQKEEKGKNGFLMALYCALSVLFCLFSLQT